MLSIGSEVGLEAELTSDELRYLAEEISKQSVKGTAWSLFIVKLYQERDKLRKKLLSRKESRCDDLENPRSVHIAKA